MAQKTIRMGVVLFGRVDNTFGRIGNELVQLGAQVDQISQKLIDFGKESVEVYRNYEDSMLDAEGALATLYGRGTPELKRTMKELDALATETAESTIFHTNDVANAINEAAHANWNLETILSGIPAAVRLAQAGGMDLSTAMDYMITSVNAGNVELENMSHWIDIWTFAANSSAGTVQEFGEAFERMGKTMTFADNGEELVTMLAILHDSGTKGAAAGTLLRNTMIRLIAPTQKASDVMMALGISEGDMNEALAECDGNLEEATKLLEQAGFSAYDSNGELKGFIEIFGDLDKALEGMTEAERNNVLSAIFPTRSIQGAIALLDDLSGSANELYDALARGEAEGYGSFLSELLTSGVTGDIELFKSKWENLQKRVGEFLAPDVRNVTEALGGILDKIDAMDETKFNTIAGALKGIAVAGPGMMLTGLALKGIGALFTPAGAMAAAVAGLVAWNAAVQEYNETNFENKFGTGSLDTESLNAYLTQIGNDFNAAQEKVTGFKTAVDAAVTSYTEASGAFASDILTAVLTNQTFTDPEKQQLQQMGVDIFNYVNDGIRAANDASAEYWNLLFSKDGIDSDDPHLKEIISLLSISQEEMLAEAAQINEGLNQVLMKGFEEGFTEDDYAKILEYFRQYNQMVADAQAEAQREEDFVQQQMWLHKAQTASMEEMQDMVKTVTDQRDQILEEIDQQYYSEYYRLVKRGADQEELDAAKAEYEDYRMQNAAAYDEFLTEMWRTGISQGELSDAYAKTMQYAGMYLNGSLNADTAVALLKDEFGSSKYAGDYFGSSNSDRAQLGKALGLAIQSLGGESAVAEKIDYYEKNNQQSAASQLRTLLAMEQLINNFQKITTTDSVLPWDIFGMLGLKSDFSTTGMSNDSLDAAYNAMQRDENLQMMEGMAAQGYGINVARKNLQMFGGELKDFFQIVGSGTATQDELFAAYYAMSDTQKALALDTVDSLKAMYDLQKLNNGDAFFGDYYAAARLMNMGGAAEKFALAPQVDPEVAAQLAGELGPVDVEVGFPNAVSTAQTTHAQMASQFTTIYQDVVVRQSGSTTTGSTTMPKKARGGRETVPSIFAEAGIPEWYIPEEHTKNTAQLILGAAYGSGFDIIELAEMAGARKFAEGGVSGGGDVSLPVLDWGSFSSDLGAASDSGGSGSGGGSTIQVQYSPVIHADNSEGVEKALKADKARFEKWINEWWQNKQLYESMVKYE